MFILFLLRSLSSNLFAQLDYQEDIKTVMDRTAINLSIPDGFILEAQEKRNGICRLFAERPADDIKVRYIIWGTRDYI